MKTPVALLNLWHERTKTLVSIGGVAFALLLVFAQLGFMGAVSYTATNIFSNLEFDILIRSQNYVHLYEPGSIDRQVLSIAKNVPESRKSVRFGSPCTIGGGWTIAEKLWRALSFKRLPSWALSPKIMCS